MKKILSVLLILALLLGAGAVAAESAGKTEMGSLSVAGAFTLKCAVPEGYTIDVLEQTSEKIAALLTNEDTTKPLVTISIAYNDQYSDVERMNDLSEEQMKVIESSFSEMDEVKFEYRETGLGTKLLVVTETKDDVSFVDIYTIYKGFETEFVMVPGITADKEEIVPLTEEQISMLIDFITGIDFVEETPAEPEPAGEAGMLAGGWNAAADPTVTDEVRALLNKGLEGLLGVSYEPVTYLGSQVVAGRNHAILCKATVVNLNAIPTWKIVYLYEDLQGNVKLMNIADFDFGALCTYGAAE